jgi:hypothetical protein
MISPTTTATKENTTDPKTPGPSTENVEEACLAPKKKPAEATPTQEGDGGSMETVRRNLDF